MCNWIALNKFEFVETEIIENISLLLFSIHTKQLDGVKTFNIVTMK
jgi:hypothetical protein